jgi:hypothetical protein
MVATTRVDDDVCLVGSNRLGQHSATDLRDRITIVITVVVGMLISGANNTGILLLGSSSGSCRTLKEVMLATVRNTQLKGAREVVVAM